MVKEKKIKKRKELIKLSSSGTITLPVDLRKYMGLKKGGMLKTYTIGKNVIVLEKIQKTPFFIISKRIRNILKEKNITTQKIRDIVREASGKIYMDLFH